MAQPNIFLMFSASGMRRAEADADIVGEVVATDRDRAGVNHHAFVVHDQVGRSGADVDQANAQLALVGLQHGVGAGQRFEDGVVHVDAGAVQRRDHVLRRGGAGGHDVRRDLQLPAHQPGRIAHSALVVEDELLRQQVQGSRSSGMAMLRAFSTARRTSSRLISREREPR